MTLLGIVILAAGTYAFRVAGPLLTDRVRMPEHVQERVNTAATTLLVALIATSTLTEAQDFAGWSRLAGVAVGGLLALRRLPFPVVVLAAALTAALLRLAGVP